MSSEQQRMLPCEYRGDEQYPCPMPEDTLQSECIFPCSQGSDYGNRCAPILAQEFLAQTTSIEDLSNLLDTNLGLIDGRFLLTKQISTGEAPEEVRSAVYLSSDLPLRANRPQEDTEGVFVHHFDLLLTLWKRGELEAANWYSAHLAKINQASSEGLHEWWRFEATDGTVWKEKKPKTTLDVHDKEYEASNTLLPMMRAVRAAHKAGGVALLTPEALDSLWG